MLTKRGEGEGDLFGRGAVRNGPENLIQQVDRQKLKHQEDEPYDSPEHQVLKGEGGGARVNQQRNGHQQDQRKQRHTQDADQAEEDGGNGDHRAG